ncbi:ABC transporter permease subunit [Brucella pituitosa]|nr:ABC transporter permease subunit [Brucella pituitosa]MCK4207664.1 ABC transporter permease subunit [Brucella pituitosa]
MASTDSAYLRAPAKSRVNLRLLRDRLLVFAAILVLWEAMRFLGVNPLWISSPSAVGARLVEMAASGELLRHMYTTLTEAALGLLLAFAIGVPIGIAMARFRYAHAVAEPFIMALYSLPRVALAPLFIIWFGIDLFSKVMMSFSTVLFIFMLNIHEGLKTIDKDLLELFRTMKAPRSYVLRKVILPWLVPWVIASHRHRSFAHWRGGGRTDRVQRRARLVYRIFGGAARHDRRFCRPRPFDGHCSRG